jgi:hypothetical protein
VSKRESLARGNRDAYFRTHKALEPLVCKVGDRVAYAHYFLACTSACPALDERAHYRGRVTRPGPGSMADRFVYVQWEHDPEEPQLINLCNLAIVGANLRFVAD